jgi:LmbE family N-acetylglucosaminyl deacetylase
VGSTPSAGRFFTVNFGPAAADVFVPDGGPVEQALARVTHLGIGAHQDDLEFMAFHGITECFGQTDRWFGGVTCTDGAGSARSGKYAGLADAEMARLRQSEQRLAAEVGGYGAMIQLGYTSAEAKDRSDERLRNDLRGILEVAKPEVVYTHNLADKHPTHIAVVIAVIDAVRALPRERRPRRLIGCEGWRDLDWLPDDEKVVMDVSGYEALAAKLSACFASQIEGGKRYDLAVAGRRAANATFADPHAIDETSLVIYGMDLTPLIVDEARVPTDYIDALIGRFGSEVQAALRG